MSVGLTCGVLLAVEPLAVAELVYQPPPPPTEAERDAQWRQAGSELFKGVSFVYDALADVELKRRGDAAGKLDQALDRFKGAMSRYRTLAEEVKEPGGVFRSKLRQDQKDRLNTIEKVYGVKVPGNERDAAVLGSAECLRVLELLARHREAVIAANKEAVRTVLAGIVRLQEVGASTAELMTTLVVAK